MSGEQQLERSVLEAKEREELQAIAEALGVKPASRASKATLVGQILKATGVEEPANGSAAAPARRGRRPRTTTTVAGADDGSTEHPSSPDSPLETWPGGAGEVAGDPESQLIVESDDGQDQDDAGAGGKGAAEGSTNPAPAGAAEANGAHGPAGEGSPVGQQAERTTSAPAYRTNPQRDNNHGAERAVQRSWEPGGGGQGPGQGQGTPESANRRRRRRGRERDQRTERPDQRSERDLQGSPQDQQFQGEPVPVSGLLDLNDQGYGFLRARGYLPSPDDAYVSISQVRRFALRNGDHIEGACRPAGSTEKYPALLRIDTVSGLTPEEARTRARFEDLTPLFPDQKLRLEIPGDNANMVSRIVDLISPIGKGQRGLIVSPPKAGKTTVLKQIAHSIEVNNPDVHLMVLLVDERPEEVTDMRRSVKGEVMASTFDRPAEEHTALAELAIDRARRLAELGRDVVIVLDGITRLARAYNLAAPATGRIMAGGIDTGALYPPKKFFGAARNLEEGGSLTILATALVETNNRMDEVIFEEFKGTGNMELRLDRKLAERRIYPAIDVNASSTRHEELLFERNQLQQVWKLRRVLNALASEGSAASSLELLMDKIKATRSNDEFLSEIAKGPAAGV
ncbi:MAG TPA: transcription termination factor Rho [Acidimicrobiales bacterium]|nr:transcription termination factor Rho [Acidimicrobiales bacterium]